MHYEFIFKGTPKPNVIVVQKPSTTTPPQQQQQHHQSESNIRHPYVIARTPVTLPNHATPNSPVSKRYDMTPHRKIHLVQPSTTAASTNARTIITRTAIGRPQKHSFESGKQQVVRVASVSNNSRPILTDLIHSSRNVEPFPTIAISSSKGAKQSAASTVLTVNNTPSGLKIVSSAVPGQTVTPSTPTKTNVTKIGLSTRTTIVTTTATSSLAASSITSTAQTEIAVKSIKVSVKCLMKRMLF